MSEWLGERAVEIIEAADVEPVLMDRKHRDVVTGGNCIAH